MGELEEPKKPKELRDLMYEFFQECKQDKLINNLKFCNGFIGIMQDYFSNGHVYTVDTGTVGSQSFVGAGTSISIKGDEDSAKAILSPILESLNAITEGGDIILANGIANSLSSFFANSEIRCTVIGSGGNGTSKGNISFDIGQTLSALLILDFGELTHLSMETVEQYNERLEIGTKYIDTDDRFCDKVSKHIKGLMENPLMSIVSTQGEGTLLSVSGVGYWSFKEVEQDDEDDSNDQENQTS